MTDALTPVMQRFPTQEWVERLEALKIGCGPINRLSDVFADPQVQARGMVVDMPHEQAAGGTVKVVANPVRLSATPASYRITPPALGEHTDAGAARAARHGYGGDRGAAGEKRALTGAVRPVLASFRARAPKPRPLLHLRVFNYAVLAYVAAHDMWLAAGTVRSATRRGRYWTGDLSV